MGRRRLARRPLGVEPVAIGEINVQPAVVVVIEKGKPASLSFDDVSLAVDGAPDVRYIQSCFACDVDEHYRRLGV